MDCDCITFPHLCFLLLSDDTGVEVGVDYTDYYTYLRRMGYAGRFGTGVYIYVFDLVHRSAPRQYICRVAGCPLNGWVMSDFLQKLENLF